ncbi:type IV pilus secretin family protein [Sulfuriferula nivalis]|uniref:Type IV pilus biogenesis and competence protein PilQ n=1 Tax=Sulfuriferula nivalis TaxID=2675298 RepID=A0A809S4I7_9PROT|nr:type IV pilus secretin family protein [Sulfuriferula nivalis]BBP01898.1 pilus assembly protein PilQ [Sulfuriferula nivalis]
MKNTITHFSQHFLMSIIMMCFMMFSALHAQADTNSIESLDYSSIDGGKILLKIGLKQNLQNSPAGFAINNPPRIALDLAGTANGLGKNTVNVNQGVVRTVNVVQAGERTRLVLNLTKPAQYETRIDGNALFITVQESDSQSSSNVTPHFAEPSASLSKHNIKDIDFRRGAGGEGRIITTLSDSSTGIDIRKQGKVLAIDFMNTDVARALQRRLDVTDFGTPVLFVATEARGSNVKMTIEPKADYEYSAYQADNQLIIEVRAKTEDAAKATGGKPKYSGEKLSLNFQNVEVRSVLQVIADFTGKNIITSDTVTGNLTLRLKDVPWDQALDIILQSKGLDKRENGNVIWVAPKDELLAKEKAELEARQSMETLEPLVSRQYQLNYKKADQAARILTGALVTTGDVGEDVNCSAQAQGVKADKVVPVQQQQQAGTALLNNPNRILSPRGNANFELQTNTLLVNDIASKQAEVAEMLKMIDVPARQVMIEARVVVASDTFSKSLGAKFGVQQGALAGNRIGYGGNAYPNSATSTSASTATTTSNNVGIPGSTNVNLPAVVNSGLTAGSLGLSLFNLGGGALLSLELQALESDGLGKIISSPRIITANQKPAVILQGVQIPSVTPPTANSPATVTFKDAFLCLLVNPQILNNDSIILTVEVQKDAPGTPFDLGQGYQAYPIETKRVKTQIRINNGETAVIGGIYEDNTNSSVNKVPFFGDLPLFGHLFKNQAKNITKTELLVFLTPRIVKEDLSFK